LALVFQVVLVVSDANVITPDNVAVAISALFEADGDVAAHFAIDTAARDDASGR
jgi:hypothetical protein